MPASLSTNSSPACVAALCSGVKQVCGQPARHREDGALEGGRLRSKRGPFAEKIFRWGDELKLKAEREPRPPPPLCGSGLALAWAVSL